jgi:cyclic pyranopterin phosphate synthase
MKDRYGRDINYLRISVIDRCNLRCVYCMPLEALPFVPGEDLLTPAEIEKVARAAAEVGFYKIRLTGGEPTLRPDIVEIVARLARVPGIREVVMTTNGIRLPHLALPLAQAGLQRVNIHLDSLDEGRLAQTMRRHSLQKALAGITAAEQAGLTPLKINTVIVKGYNETDVVELARLTLTHNWDVRLIELMPLGGPAEIALSHYFSTAESISRIEAQLGPLLPLHEGRIMGEARLYRLPGATGAIGFISPISDPYCDSCSRMRLTADGRLRLCLLSEQELDLLPTLREEEGRDASHQALVELFRQAVLAKPIGYSLKEGFYPKNRTMAQVGG